MEGSISTFTAVWPAACGTSTPLAYQRMHIYLSLGDKEEHTKNAVMAVVGDNIRTLHSRLIERRADCTLEWNSGGHFKDADLRTAKAFRWVMEEHT